MKYGNEWMEQDGMEKKVEESVRFTGRTTEQRRGKRERERVGNVGSKRRVGTRQVIGGRTAGCSARF